jgi:hypothetical protein
VITSPAIAICLNERGYVMYYDYKTWKDFENYFITLEGGFVSPGGICKEFKVSRQLVYYWTINNVIDAHRYTGKQGEYLIISISEFEKIKKHLNKK